MNENENPPPFLALFLAFGIIGSIYGIIAIIGLILNV
jgi:hypothetical protein